MSTVDYSVFDRPEILRVLFYPRAEWGDVPNSGTGGVALTIPVAEQVVVGGQFYGSSLTAPNILFYHGNGEIVSDYIDLAVFYKERGLNFIPVDYRGYGRSTGNPTIAFMMQDCHTVFDYVRTWLKRQGYTGPLIVMGRSLGSASALELANTRQEQIDGLIIESGFAYIGPLLALMGLNMTGMGLREDQAFRNIEKIKSFTKPTLVIHAQFDHIIAQSEGKFLYDVCPARTKKFLNIAGADHNNLFMIGINEYMNAIEWLIARIENRDE